MKLVSKSVAIILFSVLPYSVFAEVTVDLYGGIQTSPHSRVEGKLNDNDAYCLAINCPSDNIFNFVAGWQGKSFSMPPYYGVRWTTWSNNLGWGFDFNHSKAYADLETLNVSGFERLQFTDGLNTFTYHRQKKIFILSNSDRSYFDYFFVGYGLGLTIPHVEVQKTSDSALTYKYQYGGPSVAFNAGVIIPFRKSIDLLTEYKFTANWLNVDLETGGYLKTRLFTNAFNVGIRYKF